jgi:hypothetical protein
MSESRNLEEDLTAAFEAQARELREQMEHLEERMADIGLPPETADQLKQQALLKSEQAVKLAQEKIRRSQEKLERKIAQTQRKAERRATLEPRQRHPSERRGRWWPFDWIKPAEPRQEDKPEDVEPVSEDERLVVLRLLEAKKISLQEAEQLLAALEGRAG